MVYAHYPMNAQQRAAIIVERLHDGQRLTTAEIQTLCGYSSRESARILMERLSAVLPIAFVDHEWYYMRGAMR